MGTRAAWRRSARSPRCAVSTSPPPGTRSDPQWWIRRGANDKLRQGKRGGFEYRAGSYLTLVHSSLAGEAFPDQPDPAQVADAWIGV